LSKEAFFYETADEYSVPTAP